MKRNRKLLIQRLLDRYKAGGLLPPQKRGDVGWDMIVSETTTIPPKQDLPIDIPCDAGVKLPRGTWALIIGRSGAIRKSGLIIMPGVIDEGYTGPLYACCLNRTDKEIIVKAREKLAQLIIIKSTPAREFMVDKLPKTERGNSGFGSTDKK